MTKATETERRPRTTPTTIRLDVDLLDALRDTVVALSGPPVRLTVEGQSAADLAHLLAHDSDPFNRWEAGQTLARGLLLAMYDAALQLGPLVPLPPAPEAA